MIVGSGKARGGSSTNKGTRNEARRGNGRRGSFLNSAIFTTSDRRHSIEDVKNAEQWGELLREKDSLKDAALMERFYAMLKTKLIRKFGTVTAAFKMIDSSGDGDISFVEWEGMLQMMHIPLDNRSARQIFGNAAGGAKELRLDELKVILMQPTLRKMKAHFRSYKKRQDRAEQHTHAFISHLMEANADIQEAAVDRFQRKIKLPFIMGMWSRLVSLSSVKVQMQSKCIQFVTVERELLKDLICKAIGSAENGGLLMESQAPLLMNLFARVGNYRGSSVLLVDLIGSLMIVSQDADRMGKLKLMFEVFDTDEDTVLEDHQIKDMFCCICKVRPLFLGTDAHLKEEGGVAFQEELLEQEGLRHYEAARWRLHRVGIKESAIHFHDLWEAIQDQPDVMSLLLPASPLIRWVLDPIAFQIEESLPKATTPRRRQKQSSELLMSHPVYITGEEKATSSSKKPHVHRQRMSVAAPHVSHFPDGSHRGSSRPDSRQGSLQEPPAGHRPASRELQRQGSLLQDLNHRPGSRPGSRPTSRDCGRPGSREQHRLSKQALQMVNHWHDARRPQTTEFRKEMTVQFRQRLQRLGQQRVVELKEGFDNPRAIGESPRSDNDIQGSISDSSSLVLRPSTTQLGSRSAALPRLGSRVSSAGQRSDASTVLSRSSTAPLTLRPSLGGRRVHADRASDAYSRNGGDVLPAVERFQSLKWGIEAAGRHTLLVEARSSRGSECSHFHGLDTFGYSCALCQRSHELNPREQDDEEFGDHAEVEEY